MAVPKGNDVHPFFFGKWVAFEHSLFQRGLVGIDAGVGVFQGGRGSRKDEWRREIGDPGSTGSRVFACMAEGSS